MLTDSELLEHLHDVLKTSDLDTATAATVRRKLEQQLGVDLSEKKSFIRQEIDLYLQSHYKDNDNNGKDEEMEGEDNVKEEEEEEEESGYDGDNGSGSQEDESDDDEKKVKSKRNKKTPNGKKRGGGGFSKPCALSPQLQKLTGEPEMARTEVVKKIWVYIKENDLQNPKNRRKIMCDETLHEIFRVKSIDMFQMNKALTKHIWPLEEEYVTVKPSQKKKQNKRVKEVSSEDSVSSEDEFDEPTEQKRKLLQKKKQNKRVKEASSEDSVSSEDEFDEPTEQKRKPSQKKKQNKRVKEEDESDESTGQKGKRPKARGSGFASPLPISEELMQFFDTDESELSRAEVVKRMWGYIKQNDLQDPSDRRKVLCDDKLKELFKVDTFVGFTVSKLLTSHFIKE